MADQDERTVVGVFDDYATAQQAARELENSGIPREAINVESNFKTDAAGYGGAEDGGERHEGGIKGFFHRLFSTDDHEDRADYEEALRRGNAIVAVTAPATQVDRIAGIMNDLGAVDIDRRAEYYQQTGYTRGGQSGSAYTAEEAARDREGFRNQQGNTVPVIEEELQVGKRAVQRGGVRVYSRVVSQPVEEKVTLREEHVRVERRPTDRPVEAGDLSRMRDQTIEVTETVEEPVVSKRARVREEVVVGKETTERTETIRDNVRRTEVRVDPIAGGADVNAAGTRTGAATTSTTGATGETSSPGYTWGSRIASDPRYAGRSWDDVENDLRVDYMRNNPTSRWDEVKADIRRGWDKATGKY